MLGHLAFTLCRGLLLVNRKLTLSRPGRGQQRAFIGRGSTASTSASHRACLASWKWALDSVPGDDYDVYGGELPSVPRSTPVASSTPCIDTSRWTYDRDIPYSRHRAQRAWENGGNSPADDRPCCCFVCLSTAPALAGSVSVIGPRCTGCWKILLHPAPVPRSRVTCTAEGIILPGHGLLLGAIP